MTTPSGQLTANDVSSELGKLVIELKGGLVAGATEYIQVSNDYIGYANSRVAVGELVTYNVNGTASEIVGLSNNTQYYIKASNTKYVQLALGSPSNAAVNVGTTSDYGNSHWFTRTTAPFSMNDERIRRLADKTSGEVSFNDLRNKNKTKTFDSGNVVTSKLRNVAAAFIGNFERLANNSYRARVYSNAASNANPIGAVDYFTYDLSGYSNASVQSNNMTITVRMTYDDTDISPSGTQVGFGPFMKPSNYNTTAEPGEVTITDSGNIKQNPYPTLFSMTNKSITGNIVTGDVSVTFPLQNNVTVGNDGGWSVGTQGQWNMSKIANTEHAVSFFVIAKRRSSTVTNTYPIQVHWCRINGAYTIS